MARTVSPFPRLPTDVRQAVHTASPVVVALARAGHLAKGVLYVTIGVLAVRAAVGLGGETTDSYGALRNVFELPFGRWLTILVAIGMFGYAMWRLIEAAIDPVPPPGSTRWKAGLRRIGCAISGAGYAMLGVTAVEVFLGARAPHSHERSSKHWTAALLAQPYGAVLVAIVGAIVIGVGIFQIRRAWTCDFRRELAWGGMSSFAHRLSTWTGRLGFAAQGLVFALIGAFLVRAAAEDSARRARGIAGALAEIGRSSLGPALLGAVAVGLVFYGLHMFVEARYRRFTTTS